MPRYVLIEFDDNAQADAFVAKTLLKEEKGAKYRVIGLFAKPRNFCQCPPSSQRQVASETARGVKYGWMVHRNCGRPRREASHSPRNLLDPEGTHPSRVASFLHLMGAWAGEHRVGQILENYPISVRTREDDR
jgi:hypothetical protein